MSHGLTGAVSGASARASSTASTTNMTLPANISPATYPITGTSPIASITASPQDGKVALLEFQSDGCRVIRGGNLLINGDYISTAGGILALVANGSNWEEITRTQTVIQPYNALPNSDFRGWQRPFTTGSQYTNPANNSYTADRWQWNNPAGTGVVNVVRDTSLPAIAYNMPATQYSARIDVTTADVAMAAADVYGFYSVAEGLDIQELANGFAVSWWVKAHRTGTYCLAFANRAFNRSYVVEYVIAVADTWQYFTAVVPAPIGSWAYDNQIGMYCYFCLAAGSNYIGASANTWLTTSSFATASQINGVAATSDTFSVWGLNVVPGSVPQPICLMPWPIQLTRLQRYYETIGTLYDYGYHSASMYNIRSHSWRTRKGGTPTVTLNAVNQLGNGSMALQQGDVDSFAYIIGWASTGNFGFTLAPVGEWNPT